MSLLDQLHNIYHVWSLLFVHDNGGDYGSDCYHDFTCFVDLHLIIFDLLDDHPTRFVGFIHLDYLWYHLCNTNVELYCMSVMGLHLVVLHFYHWWYPCLILLVTLCMPLPTWMTSCGVSCINWVRQKPQKKPKQKQLIVATPVMNQSNKKQMIMLPIDLKTQVIQFTGWWTTHLQ